MLRVLEYVNHFVWGVPALIMILGVGVYLSLRSGCVQITLLPAALRGFARRVRERNNTSGVSSYRALCTALAATVGTGNIAGVAGAIAIGGPGAIFWMWVSAAVGMVTKFAEAALSVRYRQVEKNGEIVGGPMHMICQVLPRGRWLAGIYCFLGMIASFGVGNGTQINAVIGGFHSILDMAGVGNHGWIDLLIGMAMAGIIMTMMLGGAKRIGAVAERLVPIAAIGYVLLCTVVIVARYRSIPSAISMIVGGAFDPSAVTGGLIGSMFIALRIGISRGVFTNEAGLGTAAIAHASADVSHPVEQGLMGIVEVFLDTIVICTMTALVILCSGIEIPYGTDTGIALTTDAFSSLFGEWISIPITAALCCFAVATIFGWGLYGIRCAQFLFGVDAWKPFVYLQALTAVISAVLGTGTVWMLAETVNGLMAIPNLIVLAYLTPELKRLVADYDAVKSAATVRS